METYNIADTLRIMAERAPFRCAIVLPAGRTSNGRAKYTQFSFQQLNQECDAYAHGLTRCGICQGQRVLLLIHPGIELIAVTFALIKMGAVPILIDPGMGRKAFLQCVAESEPAAFIGIPAAHFLRILFPKAFKTVDHVITVGRRWGWGGKTLDEVRTNTNSPFQSASTTTESEAAVTFTSGSTGIPKGVVYSHGMFKAMIDLLRDEIGIQEGEIDLPGLYIFALLDPALGVTAVMPDMDPTKPAKVNPAFLVEAIQTFGVTMSFGSPTIWKRVNHYCHENDIRLLSMKHIFMAGAPVPPSLISEFSSILPNGEIFTPFGATEALPITNISAGEILAQTAVLSNAGGGVCVGRVTSGNTIRIIRIIDEPILEWDQGLVVPQGEVGEIVVKGGVVTRLYLNRPKQTAAAKITDQDGIWHRMGDLGYFDEKGRLWVCGRKAHRLETVNGLMLPDPCEAIFNHHPHVARTALVGVGKKGKQEPVLVVEPLPSRMPSSKQQREKFIGELRSLGSAHAQTRSIQRILFYPSFPVDVRHNVKIQREKLAVWAGKQI